MCWQRFVRFRCGHTQLTEEECDYARELDLSFWLKVGCPHYCPSRRDDEAHCGEARFYCADTDDGKYLDMVLQQKALAEQRITQLDAAVADKLTPWEDSVILQIRRQYNHVPYEVRQAYATHPHILKIKSLRHDIHHERQNVCAKLHDADTTLYYSSEFFKLNTLDGRVRPRLPGYLRQFGQTAPPIPIPQLQRPSQNGWFTNPYHDRRIASGASRALQEKPDVRANLKPARTSKQTPPVEAPVRRSARGKKQVNYMEDEFSEPSEPSQPSSPERSPVVVGSSLKDMILEQRQRAARLKLANQAEAQDNPVDGSATPETSSARRAGDAPSQVPHTYDKLRESFAKQVNLTPTNLTPSVTTNTSTAQYTVPTAMMGSPLKRKISSSPALPSHKRLQLDWPSGESPSSLSASSPPPVMKMEGTDSAAWSSGNTMHSLQAARAPRAPPTAPSVPAATLRCSNGMPHAWEHQQRGDARPTADFKHVKEEVIDELFGFSDIDWVDHNAA